MAKFLSKALALAVLLLGAAAATVALGTREPGHVPLHFGCTNHNHGPKWHADHGRILGVKRSRDAEDTDAAPGSIGLAARSLTAGRPTGARGGSVD